MLADIILLNIDTPMINPTTGKPIRALSNARASELGIKTNFEMEQRMDEFPISKLSDVITSLFDATPMPSSNMFSIYNDITIDIRKAKQKGDSTIQITKDSLEKFKKIFSEKPPKEPSNNRNVGFVLECIELALAKAIIAPTS